uniref:Branched-chain amino acid transport system permease protein n=1 Tax=Candidatus Kentrum sp. DK TaxID=2126562 RepID=A0A450S248_9GAMM|nr:MAG: branched-chain amino acid transport system permease protein [Candidatus Kentron sp. DK]
MDLLLQLLANGLVNGALFALLACAFGLVYRSLRVFHIAFAGLFLIPPYAAYAANAWLGAPIWLAIIFGVAAGAISGYLIELILYRPFFRRNVSGGAVIVASLGAFIIIENLLAMGFGSELKTMGRGLAERFVLGPVSLTSIQIIQFLVATAALTAVGITIRKVRTFKIIWAMGDEPGLVPVLGLPLMRYRTLVFMVSAGLAGLAGGLIAMDVGVDPHMGLSYLLIAAVAVLAGGIDRFWGWVLGGVVLALLQSLMVWKFSAQWMDLVTFGVLIGILLFRPQGMLGLRKRLEEE